MHAPPHWRRRALTRLLLGLVLPFASGCITLNLGIDSSEMMETILEGESGPKVLLLDIDGEITSADSSRLFGFMSNEGTVSRVRDQLAMAKANDDIAAVLLRIDSPGGSASASDAVYQQLVDFKKVTGMPVWAQFMGIGASGGYLAAMAADEVIAVRTAVTGSIGVILLGLNLSGLMDKIGVEDQTIASGAFKDAGSMLRPMTPAERAQLQTVVDDLYHEFVGAVAQGRPNLATQRVRELADGRIYSARQALKAGLIDRIDTLEGSIDRMRIKLGAESVRVVSYHRQHNAPRNLYSRAGVPDSLALSSDPLEKAWPRPGFYYLWWPGAERP